MLVSSQQFSVCSCFLLPETNICLRHTTIIYVADDTTAAVDDDDDSEEEEEELKRNLRKNLFFESRQPSLNHITSAPLLTQLNIANKLEQQLNNSSFPFSYTTHIEKTVTEKQNLFLAITEIKKKNSKTKAALSHVLIIFLLFLFLQVFFTDLCAQVLQINR